MCRALSEGGRRCACTSHTKQLANQNRARARAARRTVASRAAQFGGPELGEVVSSLPPSRLSVFLIAADQVRPGTMHEFASDLGNLPGIHNMVTEDRREHSSEFGKKNNSGKLDQHAIAQVQEAVLAFDKARLADGEGLSGAQRAKLERSINVREDAIALGLLDGRTITKERVKDFTPAQREFYANLDPEDIPSLVDVQGRVSREFWDRHLQEAVFTTEKRTPATGVSLRENNIPRLLGEMFADTDGKPIKLADDLIAERNDKGEIVLHDSFNKTKVVVPSHMRAEDALARLPRITEVSLPEVASSMTQRLVDAKFLDPTTRVGANHTRTLKSAAAQSMFASGVPVNRGEEGKAAWQNHRFLAKVGLARPVIENDVPRIEGYELSGHIRASMDIKDEVFRSTARAMNIPITTDVVTKSGSPRTVPDARYRGQLSKPQRDNSSRSGFRPRSVKENSSEAVAVNSIDVGVFSRNPPKDMVTVVDAKLGHGLADIVGEANRIVRYTCNPETVGERAHVAVAKLDDAFRTRRAMSPHSATVINATATLPSNWNSVEDGDYLSKVFTSGTRIDTNGYTTGAVNSSDADVDSGVGPRQYKVQYLSTGHLTQAGGSAVIGHGTGFRVHSVDRSGQVPVVRLVQDDLAADLASGNVEL